MWTVPDLFVALMGPMAPFIVPVIPISATTKVSKAQTFVGAIFASGNILNMSAHSFLAASLPLMSAGCV